MFQTPGKKIQLKATLSQRSDARPGNVVQGYSAQTVLAPLPSDSLVAEHSYSYDLKGNRSLYDSSNLTYFPGTDRLRQTPTATYAYDDNGNLVEKTTNDGTKLTYIYDVRNLLIEVKKTLSGGLPATIARYLYDPEGNRIQSDYPVDNSTVGYKYDLTRQITENPIIEEQAGSVRNFVYLNRKLLARVDGSFTSGTRYWYLVDHLGSTRKMVDSNGNVVWWADYEAFGKVKASGSDGSVTEVPRFTGKVWDEQVGLYYFNARWYDAATGRFISEDPLKDGTNWLAYCCNNPLLFVDPLGTEVVAVTSVGWSSMSYKQGRNAVHSYLDSTTNNTWDRLCFAVGKIPIVGGLISSGLEYVDSAKSEYEKSVAEFFTNLDGALNEYESEIESGEVKILVKTETTITTITPDGNPYYQKATELKSTNYTVMLVDNEGNVLQQFSVSGAEEIMDPNLKEVIPEQATSVSTTGRTETFDPPPTMTDALEAL